MATPADTINQLKHFFETTYPAPESINITTQFGVFMENASGSLRPFRDISMNQETTDQITFFKDVLDHAEKRFKSHHEGFKLDLLHIDREDLLASLCDQIISSIGVAHMLGMNIVDALQEVADSHDSKLDEDGQPIFSSSSVLMNGQQYFKPNLSPYI